MSNKKAPQPSGFGQSIKKFLLSVFVVFTFIAYILHERHPNPAAASAGNPTATPGGVTDTSVPSQATGTVQSLAGGYKNGTYTGPAVDVFYGLVQVQVDIQNGKIANVKFLQFPNDRRTSQEINSQAMPWLTQEAIQVQSANVNIITGATLTSEGFANSLQAALQSAKN
jgi:uncharacterized protein with FMN-binding domain